MVVMSLRFCIAADRMLRVGVQQLLQQQLQQPPQQQLQQLQKQLHQQQLQLQHLQQQLLQQQQQLVSTPVDQSQSLVNTRDADDCPHVVSEQMNILSVVPPVPGNQIHPSLTAGPGYCSVYLAFCCDL